MAVISNRDGGIYAGEHECFQGLVSSQCEHLEFNKFPLLKNKKNKHCTHARHLHPVEYMCLCTL